MARIRDVAYSLGKKMSEHPYVSLGAAAGMALLTQELSHQLTGHSLGGNLVGMLSSDSPAVEVAKAKLQLLSQKFTYFAGNEQTYVALCPNGAQASPANKVLVDLTVGNPDGIGQLNVELIRSNGVVENYGRGLSLPGTMENIQLPLGSTDQLVWNPRPPGYKSSLLTPGDPLAPGWHHLRIVDVVKGGELEVGIPARLSATGSEVDCNFWV